MGGHRPKTEAVKRFRVAHIWSSEEAQSVAEAREQALAKAETDLGRCHRGLDGKHYRTAQQVQARVNRIVGPNVHGYTTTTASPR